MNEPLLSVCLITYNHAYYIRDAIDGVLKQKVNFDWELIIADDNSTDGTREIILEYKKLHPNFIHLILQEKNVGAAQNWLDLISTPKSKYIAYFEGDDYWTDPLKLQKQVDFLEENPAYGLIHTATKIFNQKKNKIVEVELGDSKNSFNDFLIRNRIYTLTALFNSSLCKKYLEDFHDQSLTWTIGDYPMWLWFAFNSKIKFLSDCTAIHRVGLGSASTPLDEANKIKFFNSFFEIKKYFANLYGCDKEVWNNVLSTNADMKIKHSVLICSNNFYREGIDDKKRLGLDLTLKEKMYGIFLSNRFFRWILKYFLSLRKFASH